MSGYLMDLMKPIRDNKDFIGAVRNVKNGPIRAKKVKRVIFKEDGSLDTLFSMILGETQVVLDSSHVRVTYETIQRQIKLKRSCQERSKRPKRPKRVIFKGDGSFDTLFS